LYIDLTQLVHKDMIVWTGYPKPEVTPIASFEKDGYSSERVCIAMHTGTHVDAPAHFAPGKASIDEVEVGTFMGDAFVLDTPAPNPDYQVNRDDFDHAVRVFGGVDLRGATLLFATGWDRHLGDEEMYLRRCPGISKELADHLVTLGVKAVGLDTPSLDHYKSPDFATHKTLLPAGMVGFENLTGIARIAGRKIKFYALPIKLKGGSGSPIRAVAEV
jgi:kynurenine formamidase